SAGAASASFRAAGSRRDRGALRRTTRRARAARPAAARSARRAPPARARGGRRPAPGSAPPTRAPRPRRAAGLPRPLLLQFLDLPPCPRVEHVVLREPAAPCLADAELDVALRPDLMRVGGDYELEAGLLRRARVHVAQVEPVGLRVDLEERAR